MELFKLFGTIALDNSEANKGIDETTDKAEKSQSKISAAFQKVGGAAVKVGKVVATGLAAGTAAIGAITKQSLDSYADYEQLVGGVETLFKESGEAVLQYANNAYKTAGMSANEYMDTVTSFSASLLQGLGGDTEKAAKVADRAITDMSDNANKMGTSISMIQNAYQGFAKQNYTMLDNLKLGYGGTQSEMARLINDSGVLGDSMVVTAETVNQVSFDKIIEAIGVVQDRMGITGTTAKEASSTIQGSLASTKSAWQNLLTGFADDSQDLGQLVKNLADSATTVIRNIVPRIGKILSGITNALPQIIAVITAELPAMIEALLPGLLSGAEALLMGLIDALPQIIQILTDALPILIPMLISGAIKLVVGLVKALPQILSSLVKALPEALKAVWDGIKVIFSGVGEWFGKIFTKAKERATEAWANAKEKFGQTWNNIKGAFANVGNWFKERFAAAKENAVQSWSNAKANFAKVKDGIANAFSNIKEKLSAPFVKARDLIKSIADKIFGFFKGTISMPKIKLPHFGISPSGWKIGDLLKGSLPKLSIQWYAQAMDNPMIMTKPTIFGYDGSTGQLMGGGEAGSEVVSGTNTLMNMIQAAVAGENNALVYYLENLVNILADYFPQILAGMDRDIVLDSGAMVGALAVPMNQALGRISERKGRGR